MSGDIGTDTIVAADISASAVGTSELADGSVTSTDIADNTITRTDINGEIAAYRQPTECGSALSTANTCATRMCGLSNPAPGTYMALFYSTCDGTGTCGAPGPVTCTSLSVAGYILAP
jgi:hypothetical protein